MTSKPDLAKLQHVLNYRFKDESWLILALTHRSQSKTNYERLEFLGDSLLGFVVSDYLYMSFPDQPEGVLTRLRASVVRGGSLARVARNLKLGDYLILGIGEGKSGGHNRDSTLSDALEALIAAIYLDGGIKPARVFIKDNFAVILKSLDPNMRLKDAKSSLQEYLQKMGQEVPVYSVINISGEDHRQRFEVACQVEGVEKAFKGTGTSRRRAEQIAAEKAINYLRE